MLSQSWGLEAESQGVIRVGVSSGLSSWLADGLVLPACVRVQAPLPGKTTVTLD